MIVVPKLRYNIMETLMKRIFLLPVLTMLLLSGASIATKQDKSLKEHSGPAAALMEAVKSGTIASHRDINVYTYCREGGMSWAAPYIAGLAALAFQVLKNFKRAKLPQNGKAFGWLKL